MYLIPDYITEIARMLRKNQTRSEKILWNKIKNKQLWFKFLRQKPIHIFTDSNWAFRFSIPDFYCSELKLIIEVDWNIHNNPEVFNLDKTKERFINQKWINIIRIEDKDIYSNIYNVISKIKQNIKIS